jgi:hypothetical protein
VTEQPQQLNVLAASTNPVNGHPKDTLSAIAAFHVDIDPTKLQESGWFPGPLPVPVTVDDEASSNLVTATEDWRRNIVLPQAANLLYGGYHNVGRWHCERVAEIPWPSASSADFGMTGIGAELLLLPPARKAKRLAILLVHFELDCPYPIDARRRCLVIAQLKFLTRGMLRAASDADAALRWELPPGLAPWIPTSCSAAPNYLNALVGIHLISHAGFISNDEMETSHQARWTPDDFWDWHLAMCSPPTRRQINNIEANIPPDPGRLLVLPQSRVRLTRIGFVQKARVPSTKGNFPLALQDLRRFRTIYTDALLLVMAQQRLLDWLTEETSRIEDPGHDTRTFQEVARNLRIFRNRWWVQEYTTWQQPDRLMCQLQELIGLDKHFYDLKEDHEFFAAIAQASESTFFNRTLLALTFFSIISCVASVLSLFGDNFHQASFRGWLLGAASIAFGSITYMLLRRSGLDWRKR